MRVSTIVQEVADVALSTLIGMDIPLMDAGLDSIAAVEFMNNLQAQCEMEITPTMIFDHPTLSSIATFLEIGGTGTPRSSRLTPALALTAQNGRTVTVIAWSYQFTDSLHSDSGVQSFVARG